MIIFGCITKYKPEDIRPYVESIDQSGFKGGKVMLVYDVPQETIDYLKSKGWDLYGSELQQHIILQRFRDAHKILENYLDETIYIRYLSFYYYLIDQNFLEHFDQYKI